MRAHTHTHILTHTHTHTHTYTYSRTHTHTHTRTHTHTHRRARAFSHSYTIQTVAGCISASPSSALICLSLSSHLSLDSEGRWCTTDDFATSFLHFPLFSTALWDLANSRPVHFLMLSSHLFLCLPCLIPSFTVPCKIFLARPDERETCPYQCSLCLCTVARRSSCGQIACWILARTYSLVTWSL